MKFEDYKNEMLKDEKFRKEYEKFSLSSWYFEWRMKQGLPPLWFLKPWTWFK